MNPRTGDPAGQSFLSGGGATGALIRGHDWANSPLGSSGLWPQSLRTAVGIVLQARQPMFVAWGPELTFLYNDDYAPIFGARHPGAMGQPFAEVWSDIWEQIEPLVLRTMSGEASFHEDLLIPMERHGYREEAWFTFSYTPVRDETGAVAGILCAATETTRQVLAERRTASERERLVRLFEQSPGFMAFLEGPDQRIELANPAYMRLTGLRDILGKSFAEALPEAVEQGYLELLEGVRRSGEAHVATGARYVVASEPGGPIVERYVDVVFQPISGPDGAVTGIFVEGYDVTERTIADRHLRLMVNELNHRVKNSLATVQAIASQTFRDPDRFEHSKRTFSARLQALARAHDILTEENWSGATLRQVIDRTVGPHGGDAGERFRLDGPPVVLTPKMALSLSMALHELCTNAVKYGSLSVDAGHVDLVWTLEPAPSQDSRLRLTWRERGGPPVLPATRKGFGSRLIERSLAAELDGTVTIDYRPDGVVCTIDAPLTAD